MLSGHIAKKCTSSIKCHSCSGRHHLAVCDVADQTTKVDNRTSQSDDRTQTHGLHVGSTPLQGILLQTANVIIENTHHVLSSVYALFESDSQLSYITPSLRNQLNLKN